MNSGPMKNILEFLSKYDEFVILKFDQEMILKAPIEVTHNLINLILSQDWPQCDVLISFYSTGFPLDKAI